MTLLKLLTHEKTITRCIWKDVIDTTNLANEELEKCRSLCDGYNINCQYYFTKRAKYDQPKRSL